LKWRKVSWVDEHLDAARLAGDAANEASPLKLDDHAVNARRRDQKKGLEISLSWRSTIEHHVRLNEGQVLALFLSESLGCRSQGSRKGMADVIDNANERTLSRDVVARRTHRT
jgi:hypothetical protein